MLYRYLDVMLQLFDINIHSFAIAGGLVLFIMAIEMLLDIVFL